MKITQSIFIFGGILVMTTVILASSAHACDAHKDSAEVKKPETQTTVQDKSKMDDGRKLVLLQQAGLEVFGPPAPEPEPESEKK